MLRSSDPVYQRDGTVTTLEDIADNAVLTPGTPFIDGATTETLQDFVDERIDYKSFITSGAGAHNSIYRGVHLGNEVTTEQWEQIVAGTFDDLFIGDYWKIDNINYRIAAFDYFYNVGNTRTTDHHIVLIPDIPLLISDATTIYRVNSTNVTTGGYKGTGYYSGTDPAGVTNNNKELCTTIVNNAFGANHILTHKERITSAVTNGVATSNSWEDCTVELPSEVMIYGTTAFGNNGVEVGSSTRQFPLFAFTIAGATDGNHYYLRTIASATNISDVDYQGYAATVPANFSYGSIRPYFCIYQPITTTETKKSATKKRSVKK